MGATHMTPPPPFIFWGGGEGGGPGFCECAMGRCYRCGHFGHYSSQCFASTHATGGALESEESEESEEEEMWACTYCDQLFATERGALFHEQKWCRRRVRRPPAHSRVLGKRSRDVAAVTPQQKGVYVLLLDNGTRYVGKSTHVAQRLEQHRSGQNGSVWCRQGGTSRMRRDTPRTPPLLDLNAWEQNETVEQMLAHGCNNVRGWEFTSCRDLTVADRLFLEKLVMGRKDACRKCGREGHMANACTATSLAPWLQEVRPT